LSALFAHTTEMRLGLFLFLFNLPYIFMARRQINRRFAMYTVLGLACLTIGSLALHRFPPVISDPLPAAIGGGICLGFGIGLSVRFGGSARQAGDQGFSLLSGGPPRSAEKIILLLNCTILLAAGALFGWDQAMYSIIAYLLAFEGVRLCLHDLSVSHTVWITSRQCEVIRTRLSDTLNRDSALVDGSAQPGQMGTLFCLTDKAEEQQLLAFIRECDPECSISINKTRLFRNRSNIRS